MRRVNSSISWPSGSGRLPCSRFPPTRDLVTRAGMDLNPREGSNDLRKDSRRKRESGPMQLVSQPMQQDGVEPRVAEKDFDGALRGRVAAKDGIDLLPNGSKHVRLHMIISFVPGMQKLIRK